MGRMMYSVASEHDLEYSLFQYQGEDKDNLNKKKRSYRSVNKKVNLSSKQTNQVFHQQRQ